MQQSPYIPQWMQLALTGLASAFGGIGIDRLYNSWLQRRKPDAEIHRTHAESAEIFIRAGAAASDSVARMMDRLDLAQLTIDRLRQERDAWQHEYDKEFRQRRELTLRVDLLVIEADSLRDQMEGAYNYIKFLGRHPTDVDRFRVQLKEGKPPEGGVEE
jgi:hypothetical protein